MRLELPSRMREIHTYNKTNLGRFERERNLRGQKIPKKREGLSTSPSRVYIALEKLKLPFTPPVLSLSRTYKMRLISWSNGSHMSGSLHASLRELYLGQHMKIQGNRGSPSIIYTDTNYFWPGVAISKSESHRYPTL